MNETNLGSRPVTDAELAAFLVELNAKRKAHFATAYPGLYAEGGSRPYESNELLAARIGGKNIKIVVTSTEQGHSTQKPDGDGRYSRSVYCFIEKATGNILKAAGWAAPAKGVRGSIRKDWRMTALEPHSAAYLR